MNSETTDMYTKGLFYELQLSGNKQAVIKLSDVSGQSPMQLSMSGLIL